MQFFSLRFFLQQQAPFFCGVIQQLWKTTSTVLRRRNFRGVDEGAGESPESDVSGTLFGTIFTLDFATVAICFWHPTFALACSAGSAGTNSLDGPLSIIAFSSDKPYWNKLSWSLVTLILLLTVTRTFVLFDIIGCFADKATSSSRA